MDNKGNRVAARKVRDAREGRKPGREIKLQESTTGSEPGRDETIREARADGEPGGKMKL